MQEQEVQALLAKFRPAWIATTVVQQPEPGRSPRFQSATCQVPGHTTSYACHSASNASTRTVANCAVSPFRRTAIFRRFLRFPISEKGELRYLSGRYLTLPTKE